MARDLNGVSRPHAQSQPVHTSSSSVQNSPNLSRRTSSIMGPPPVPQNSSIPNSPRPPTAAIDSGVFAPNAGPIRHPRPLTAAELHLELEKEQESIVNRLTRELSALRAQTASVASTTSSTSDLFTTAHNDPYLYGHNAPNIIPTSARRHRSSSNLSSRSARSTRDTLATAAAAGATSVSGVAAPRDRDQQQQHYNPHSSNSHHSSSRPSIDIPRPEISRQNSTSGGAPLSAYRSSSSTNAATTNATSPHWTAHQRHNVSGTVSTASHHEGRSPSTSFGAAQAQARYEEVALQKAELESVKRENEALKMKIRELERSLSEKGSAATTSTSSTIATLGEAGRADSGTTVVS